MAATHRFHGPPRLCRTADACSVSERTFGKVNGKGERHTRLDVLPIMTADYWALVPEEGVAGKTNEPQSGYSIEGGSDDLQVLASEMSRRRQGDL